VLDNEGVCGGGGSGKKQSSIAAPFGGSGRALALLLKATVTTGDHQMLTWSGLISALPPLLPIVPLPTITYTP
jgi:hypothetical protein